MAKGMTTSTAQTDVPVSRVRSTQYAQNVPMTAHRTVTTTVSRTVFQSSVAVSRRQMSADVGAPTSAGLEEQEDQGKRERRDTMRRVRTGALGAGTPRAVEPLCRASR